ncbi:MAG: tRNA threonylcarbamoyladenosine biosynthesis protein TsaE [Candidatus Anoxychlamydiales bacterium]|nr:tRNA threonylcarbamoyladenosine biosynthesis protein TsaE [Candidatus Anoxychlamydiales bacterium]
MAQITKIVSSSYKETIQIGIDLSKKLRKKNIVAFLGNLGAGKTTLIKGIVKGLSKENINVNSPTFTYLNIYRADIEIYHFDLYRIKDKNAFFSFGFEEYFSKDGITLIEWAENILEILPKDTIYIKMNHLDDTHPDEAHLHETHITENKREIEISY